MTQVKALKKIIKTTSEHTQPLLMLDGYGQINVLIVDNLDECLDGLQIRKNKQLSVSDIVNANIVYSLAKQLNLDPGIYREADNLIYQYIESHISPNIRPEDIPQVMSELKASWARLHQHALAKRYIPVSDYQSVDRFISQPPFAGFGGYELFIKDYLYGLTRLCLDRKDELSPTFCVLMDVVYRSLQGLNYTRNCFHENENVLVCLQWQCESKPYRPILNQKNKRQEELDKLKGAWFARVLGTILIDLQDFDVDFPKEAGFALASVIDEENEEREEIDDVGNVVRQKANKERLFSEDGDMQLQLKPLVDYLSSLNHPSLLRFMRSCKFFEGDLPSKQQRETFQAAIKYAIAHFAELRLFMLKQHREVEIYFWAKKGLLHEEKIVDYLANPLRCQSLKDFELAALCKYSEHQVVQAIVQAEKMRRDSMAILTHRISLMSIGVPITPSPLLFRQPLSIGSTFSPPRPIRSTAQPQATFDETVPDEENILLLAEPGGMCAVM